MERWSRFCWLGIALLLAAAQAFAPLPRATMTPRSTVSASKPITQIAFGLQDEEPRLVNKLETIIDRLDTMKMAGFVDNSSCARRPLLMRGPGFKRVAFWLFVGFMYKWYRARFINKIPVWDRQPQWNMVVTNKEQEKELKAYTCKNCGSTLFIARNRNWFFEGDTGLGGLGCYTCGAKGKDNFVMDRDRILEDVGEDDDYFDYERPLDFVTAAERRALLKKAKGDEDVANQMLIDQSMDSTAPPEGAMDAVIEKTVEETTQDEEAVDSESAAEDSEGEPKKTYVEPIDDQKEGNVSSSAEVKPKKKKKKKKKKAVDATSSTSDANGSDASSTTEAKQQTGDEPKVKKPKKKKVPEAPPKEADTDGDSWDDFDALGI